MRGTSPSPSKGGECLIDKDLLSKLIAYYLISLLNHYPICPSPPLEGLGEVFPFVLFRHLFGTPLLWRGWGRSFLLFFSIIYLSLPSFGGVGGGEAACL